MIKLTEAQIQILRDLGFEYVVIANSYTSISALKTLGEANFNIVLGKLGITGNWTTYVGQGQFQDLNRFREFLKTSAVYKAAILAGQNNPTVRKLVFELTFWVGSEVGEISPNTILAVWQELNGVTKGAIKASAGTEAITTWNKAIDDCMMLAGFKL
jgi:hypothetical protein